MACSYFSTSGGNYCGKSGTYQSDDHAGRYCKSDSNCHNCPIYRGSSGCFLTTACVHHAGLPDDCKELTGMRNFRDRYLLSLSNGQAMYDEYYRLAPAIVEAIEHDAERVNVLMDILTRVRQCVHLADNGNNEAALDIYTGMFDDLKNQFVCR